MTKVVVIGLAGANAAIAAAFASAAFPLEVVVTNLMPRAIVLPDIGSLHLNACKGEGDSSRVSIASIGKLQALASNIQQIAALNGYSEALALEVAETAPVAAPAPVPAPSEAENTPEGEAVTDVTTPAKPGKSKSKTAE